MGQRVKKVQGSGSTASARHYLYAEDGTSLIGEYFQTNAAAPVGALYDIVYREGTPVAVMRGGLLTSTLYSDIKLAFLVSRKPRNVVIIELFP